MVLIVFGFNCMYMVLIVYGYNCPWFCIQKLNLTSEKSQPVQPSFAWPSQLSPPTSPISWHTWSKTLKRILIKTSKTAWSASTASFWWALCWTCNQKSTIRILFSLACFSAKCLKPYMPISCLRHTRFPSLSQTVVYSPKYQGLITWVLRCSLLQRACSIRTMPQRSPLHHYKPWPTCFCQTLPFGPWETNLHQSRVLCHGESWNYLQFQFTLEFSHGNGEEEKWWMGSWLRLPPFKQCHHA